MSSNSNDGVYTISDQTLGSDLSQRGYGTLVDGALADRAAVAGLTSSLLTEPVVQTPSLANLARDASAIGQVNLQGMPYSPAGSDADLASRYRLGTAHVDALASDAKPSALTVDPLFAGTQRGGTGGADYVGSPTVGSTTLGGTTTGGALPASVAGGTGTSYVPTGNGGATTNTATRTDTATTVTETKDTSTKDTSTKDTGSTDTGTKTTDTGGTDTGTKTTDTGTTTGTDTSATPTLSLSVSSTALPENAPAGAVLATISTDGTISVSGNGASMVSVQGNQIVTTVPLDHEALSALDITITARSAGGLTTSRTLHVAVTDIDEAPSAPSVSMTDTTLRIDTATSGTEVARLSSTDPEGHLGGYRILSGGDGFSVGGDGRLVVSGTLTVGQHNVVVAAFDASGNLSGTVSVPVAVEAAPVIQPSVNTAPSISIATTSSIPENTGNATVATISASDPDSGDTITYTLGGRDAGLLQVVGNEVRLSGAGADHESITDLQFTVTATDNHGGSTTVTVGPGQITVTNVNEAPTGITVASGSTSGGTLHITDGQTGVIATFATAEPDVVDSHTYTLSGADAGHFSVDGAGNLTVASSFDRASQASASVTVTSTDGGGLSTSQTFTVSVDPAASVNHAPTDIAVSGTQAVAENVAGGQVVASLVAVDSDGGDTATYSVVGGADSGHFAISGSNLTVTAPFDFETQGASASVIVRATDGSGATYDKTVSIAITDANEAPTAITLSGTPTIAENVTGSVATLGVVDPDSGDTATFTIVGGAEMANFAISGNDLMVVTPFDYEVQGSSASVTVRATDSDGHTVDRAITVAITDVAEGGGANTPTAVSLSASAIAENQTGLVGTLSTTDADPGDTFTYSIVGGSESGSLSISGNTLQVTSPLDYETLAGHAAHVTVRTTDSQGHTYDQALNVNVSDVNEAPTSVSLSASSISDGATGAVGTLSATDPDSGETATYTIVGGTDAAHFAISGNTLSVATPFDHSVQTSGQVVVRVTDSGGLTHDQTISVSVGAVNHAPTAVTLSSSTVAENATGAVGTLSTTDPDSGDTATYSIVGGADQAHFMISGGNTLSVSSAFDYETQGSHAATVVVRSTDGGGLTHDETLTVNITNTNEAPTAIGLTASSIADGATGAVGTLSATDLDAGDTATYTIVGGTDQTHFTISGNTLSVATPFDHSVQTSGQVVVRVTDSGGLTHDQTISVSVGAVNHAPTAITLASSTIAENATGDLGVLSSVDQDAGDTASFSIVGGADQAHFTFGGGGADHLVVSTPFDYETQGGHTATVIVRVTDGGGLTHDQTITISVSDVNEAPTALTITGGNTVNENVSGSTWTLSTTDPDTADSFTYSIVGGPDQAHFSVSGSTLTLASAFDYEAQTSGSVVIRSTDGAGHTIDRTLSLTIGNVADQAPTGVTLSATTIAENTTNSTFATLSSVDADGALDSHTFSVVGGAQAANFAVSGSTLQVVAPFDHEAGHTAQVVVRDTDGQGHTYDQTLTVTVSDVDEAPNGLVISNSTVAENSGGATVGVLSATDPEGQVITWSIAGGADAGLFAIAAGNQLRLVGALDYEQVDSRSVIVRATDAGGNHTDLTVTIAVTDVNETPTSITVTGAQTIAENATGTVASLAVVDPDVGETQTYSIVGGADQSHFVISGTDLVVSTPFDFETQGGTASVTLRATDNGGLFVDQTITIAVTDVNEAPTAVSVTGVSSVNENVTGTTWALGATDPDSGDAFTYSIVGGADQAHFSLSGSTLTLASAFDYEIQHSASVVIRATDQGGLTYDHTFTLTINDVAEGPVAVAPGTAGLWTNANNSVWYNANVTNFSVDALGGVDDLTLAAGSNSFSTVRNLETMYGTASADSLTFSESAFSGGTTSQTVSMGAGDDSTTLRYDDNFAISSAVTFDGGAGTDAFSATYTGSDSSNIMSSVDLVHVKGYETINVTGDQTRLYLDDNAVQTINNNSIGAGYFLNQASAFNLNMTGAVTSDWFQYNVAGASLTADFTAGAQVYLYGTSSAGDAFSMRSTGTTSLYVLDMESVNGTGGNDTLTIVSTHTNQDNDVLAVNAGGGNDSMTLTVGYGEVDVYGGSGADNTRIRIGHTDGAMVKFMDLDETQGDKIRFDGYGSALNASKVRFSGAVDTDITVEAQLSGATWSVIGHIENGKSSNGTLNGDGVGDVVTQGQLDALKTAWLSGGTMTLA